MSHPSWTIDAFRCFIRPTSIDTTSKLWAHPIKIDVADEFKLIRTLIADESVKRCGRNSAQFIVKIIRIGLNFADRERTLKTPNLNFHVTSGQLFRAIYCYDARFGYRTVEVTRLIINEDVDPQQTFFIDKYKAND